MIALTNAWVFFAVVQIVPAQKNQLPLLADGERKRRSNCRCSDDVSVPGRQPRPQRSSAERATSFWERTFCVVAVYCRRRRSSASIPYPKDSRTMRVMLRLFCVVWYVIRMSLVFFCVVSTHTLKCHATFG